MTKDEVLKALEPFPGNMQVMIRTPHEEFAYTPLESVIKEEVLFYEPGNPDCEAEEDCIVLDIE